jgi:hypothetical protein
LTIAIIGAGAAAYFLFDNLHVPFPDKNSTTHTSDSTCVEWQKQKDQASVQDSLSKAKQDSMQVKEKELQERERKLKEKEARTKKEGKDVVKKDSIKKDSVEKETNDPAIIY